MPQDKFLQRREYVIANCGIRQVLTQKNRNPIQGLSQRVGLAMAILHDPENINSG
jgi:ABC-type Na+ transport system ATPase subunit NatA